MTIGTDYCRGLRCGMPIGNGRRTPVIAMDSSAGLRRGGRDQEDDPEQPTSDDPHTALLSFLRDKCGLAPDDMTQAENLVTDLIAHYSEEPVARDTNGRLLMASDEALLRQRLADVVRAGSAKAAKSLAQRFPDAARIRVL
jgi:hypothetical protein